MKVRSLSVLIVILAGVTLVSIAVTPNVHAQKLLASPSKSSYSPSPSPELQPIGRQPFTPPSVSQPLFDFKSSDMKFNLATLMNILRDSRHEGWVLAAYPDPRTSKPLIGAGFSLDVEAREHPQTDLFNPRSFVEPSSSSLWQAAGLPPERLPRLLEQFERDLATWNRKKYRRKARHRRLTPALTDEEATRLLRISSIQAIHNARAYCRDFNHLTAWQQLALSQLVFQMGVNLEEFVQFLSALNRDDLDLEDAARPMDGERSEREHWKFVQQTLVDSQWAARYTTRALTVIAMFDPDYGEDSGGAERRAQALFPGR